MNPVRKTIIGGALTVAALLGGAAGATLVNGVANAQTGSSSTAPSTDGGSGRGNFPAHGSPEHEALEKPVTGDNATKAQAAAVASVPGTAGAVTTDASGNGYEVTITKADGTQTEVHLNSSFTVEGGGHR